MNTRRAVGSAPLRLPLRPRKQGRIEDVTVPPVPAGDLLLVTRKPGLLTAMDGASGAPVWALSLANVSDLPPHAGTPVIDGAFAHVCTGGEFITLRLGDGEVVRRRPSPPLDLRDGVVGDGCIVSPVGDDRIVAWDVDAGTLRWSTERPYSPVPLAGHGSLVVAAGAGSISAFDLADGHERWAVRLAGEPAISAVVIAPDGSILVTYGREILSLESESGSTQWRCTAGVARTGTMAVTDSGEIHLMDTARYQRASTRNGSVTFEREFPSDTLPRWRGSLGRLSVSHSHVFGADQRGPLMAVSRSIGRIDWTWDERRFRAASVAPVLTPTSLYALDLEGTLDCFEFG
jgi:outer membrane protein assembly factor BamB